LNFTFLARAIHFGFVLAVLRVRSKQPVPPDERRRIIADEVVVMEIVEPRAGVTGNEVQRVEKRNVVATVNVNGFHQTKRDPGPQQNNVSRRQHDSDEESHAEN